MKAVRRGLLVLAALSIGAAAGFAFSLLRPRAYADFAGVHHLAELPAGQPADQ